MQLQKQNFILLSKNPQCMVFQIWVLWGINIWNLTQCKISWLNDHGDFDGTCHQFVLYFVKGLFGTWIQALSNKNTVVGDIDRFV